MKKKELIANPEASEHLRWSIGFSRLREGSSPIRDFRNSADITFEISNLNGNDRIIIRTQEKDAESIPSYNPEMLLYSILSEVSKKDRGANFVILPYPHLNGQDRSIDSKTLIILTPEQEQNLRELVRNYFIHKLSKNQS